ncbi:helix-turn-helix domain-containing protein [Sporolactobacillus shoreicorticis]|uniref:Helix-turn-helix domain-containing protein n=1 Tax=Sporolactobacillus shoreicorticis TaxID=1923877 RepID=A0ABW5S1F2_9BACL|nr:helix-turn-helix domain-containing protein [Sporolactobacillus shoreicorticis]MCO7126746.1 helix-turn-helix domain-containing protein [Sporolactobacillus shoreicorticis]
MFSEALLLFLIRQFHGERTVSGIYHLLKGKQSSQSIQDSYLFGVKPFFHLCDDLERQSFQKLIERLHDCGWIQCVNSKQTTFIITEAGKNKLNKSGIEHTIPDGVKITNYVTTEGQFWLKLQLLIQTLSALRYHETAFLPITKQPPVTEAIRRIVLNRSLTRNELAHQLYQELCRLLTHIPRAEADLFAAQFSGYQMIGLTMKQIADESGKDLYECRMLFKSALRRLMADVSNNKSRYPLVASLISPAVSSLSNTAAVTLRLLRSGLSALETANHRNLSLSTIEDHLVEIALKEPTFDLSEYLAEELEQHIVERAHRLNTRRLKTIKNDLRENASYLQIRLALAKNTLR